MINDSTWYALRDLNRRLFDSIQRQPTALHRHASIHSDMKWAAKSNLRWFYKVHQNSVVLSGMSFANLMITGPFSLKHRFSGEQGLGAQYLLRCRSVGAEGLSETIIRTDGLGCRCTGSRDGVGESLAMLFGWSSCRSSRNGKFGALR